MRIKCGDVIGVSGSGLVSGVINVGTFGLPGSGVSHVGIVCGPPTELMVYESTSFGRPPCAIQGKRVSGVQAHRLSDFLKFNKDATVWHYPLRCALYGEQQVRLQGTLDSLLGVPYDTRGAIQAGGFFFRIVQSYLHGEATATLFCSEMTAWVLTRIGVMHTHNSSKWNPNRLCRWLVRQGVCDKPRKLGA